MTEYFDIRCGDDLDLFARDVRPLEVLAQDIYHRLITDKLTLFRDLEFGFGLASLLGKPLPSSLSADIETEMRRDDRVADAQCKITPVNGQADTYRLELLVEADGEFLNMALELAPDGIVRVA